MYTLQCSCSALNLTGGVLNIFGCFCSLFILSNIFIAPLVSVVITPTGTAVVGQLGYSLDCSVSGADSLNPTITYRWYNESSNPRSQVGTTSSYGFPERLRPYHAGEYTCEVTITTPYLDEDLSSSMMQDITLQSKLCNLA